MRSPQVGLGNDFEVGISAEKPLATVVTSRCDEEAFAMRNEGAFIDGDGSEFVC